MGIYRRGRDKNKATNWFTACGHLNAGHWVGFFTGRSMTWPLIWSISLVAWSRFCSEVALNLLELGQLDAVGSSNCYQRSDVHHTSWKSWESLKDSRGDWRDFRRDPKRNFWRDLWRDFWKDSWKDFWRLQRLLNWLLKTLWDKTLRMNSESEHSWSVSDAVRYGHLHGHRMAGDQFAKFTVRPH